MNVQEFYAITQSNYNDAIKNLRSEERILKFLKMFLEEPAFEQCEKAFGEKNAYDAFLGAHTLKGICINMGFSELFNSSSALTENLRNKTFSDESQTLFDQMKKDYSLIYENIKEIDS